jgi:hypothetical protein
VSEGAQAHIARAPDAAAVLGARRDDRLPVVEELTSSPVIDTGMKRAIVWCQPARSRSWQDRGMERVVGIGGYFMRAADPAALGAW